MKVTNSIMTNKNVGMNSGTEISLNMFLAKRLIAEPKCSNGSKTLSDIVATNT